MLVVTETLPKIISHKIHRDYHHYYECQKHHLMLPMWIFIRSSRVKHRKQSGYAARRCSHALIMGDKASWAISRYSNFVILAFPHYSLYDIFRSANKLYSNHSNALLIIMEYKFWKYVRSNSTIFSLSRFFFELSDPIGIIRNVPSRPQGPFEKMWKKRTHRYTKRAGLRLPYAANGQQSSEKEREKWTES